MKTTIITGLLFTITFLGCSHTSEVRTGSGIFMRLQQRANSGKARVTLKNNQSYPDVVLTRLAQDSTSWLLRNGDVMSVPTEEIDKIQFVNRGKGALQGLGLGLLASVPIGAIIGFAEGDDPPLAQGGDPFLFTAEEKAVLGAAMLGSVGGSIGLPVGALTGSRDVYRIELQSRQSTTTTGK